MSQGGLFILKKFMSSYKKYKRISNKTQSISYWSFRRFWSWFNYSI